MNALHKYKNLLSAAGAFNSVVVFLALASIYFFGAVGIVSLAFLWSDRQPLDQTVLLVVALGSVIFSLIDTYVILKHRS